MELKDINSLSESLNNEKFDSKSLEDLNFKIKIKE